MNQVLVACEAGHCLHETGIGSWKSYEVMAVDISRGVYGPSLDILYFTHKCSLIVWLITSQYKL